MTQPGFSLSCLHWMFYLNYTNTISYHFIDWKKITVCKNRTGQLNKQLFQRHGIVESTLKQLCCTVSQCHFPPPPFNQGNSIPTGATAALAFLGIHGGLGTEQHLDDVCMAVHCCHVQWLTASGCCWAGKGVSMSCDGVF